jgi:hypothetical protein
MKAHRYRRGFAILVSDRLDDPRMLFQDLTGAVLRAGAGQVEGEPHEAGHRLVEAAQHREKELVARRIDDGFVKARCLDQPSSE